MINMFSPRFAIALLVVVAVLTGNSVKVRAATLTDDEGLTISFAAPFHRILSLYPAHTENLASLGCEDRIIGIGEGDDFPPSINGKPRYSYRDNLEKLLAAGPDLILIRPMISRAQPELITQLRNLGVTVISLQPTSIDQMFSYWKKLGALCGQPDQAARLAEEFKAGIDTLAAHLPPRLSDRPMVYFESIHAKMKTFDPEAISIFALTAAGGRNIAADAIGRNDSNIAPYGKERLLARGSEIDVFLSQAGRMNRVSLEDIVKEPGFQLIKAVREQRVYLVEEELVSRPTMRLLEGVRQIHANLYPSGAQTADHTATSPTSSTSSRIRQ